VQAARAANAVQYARELWDAAEAKAAEAQSAFARRSLAQAARGFGEASVLYRQATEAARAARQQQLARLDEARARAARARQRAADAGASREAAAGWAQASTKLDEVEALVEQDALPNALQGFGEVERLYRQAETEAGEARRRQREESERARESMAQAR